MISSADGGEGCLSHSCLNSVYMHAYACVCLHICLKLTTWMDACVDVTLHFLLSQAPYAGPRYPSACC